jgi:hypothetical protein
MTILPLVLALAAGAAPAAAPPDELGDVRWGRDFEAGRAEAARSGRPMLVLFQEVPGCQTCVDFGRGPMSNPLIVEAIESEFVPVVVFNNHPGADARVLEACREPAWNNPVIRFFGSDGRDVIPRRDGVYQEGSVAGRMAEALRAAGRTVPPYLQTVVAETAPVRRARATLAMHCFWEGEAALGGIDGVLETRAAFLDGHEVVDVTFDEARLSCERLITVADRLGLAARVYARDEAQLEAARRVVGSCAVRSDEPSRAAPADDQKRHLRFSPLRALDLTPLQEARVNAALAAGVPVDPWLSPRQRAEARRLASADPAGRTP